jgi:hypothetical protein
VNQLEVWEIGSALGVATEHLENGAGNRPGGAPGAVKSNSRDLVAERMAHAKGLGPKPEEPVMNGIDVKALQETLRVN